MILILTLETKSPNMKLNKIEMLDSIVQLLIQNRYVITL